MISAWWLLAAFIAGEFAALALVAFFSVADEDS